MIITSGVAWLVTNESGTSEPHKNKRKTLHIIGVPLAPCVSISCVFIQVAQSFLVVRFLCERGFYLYDDLDCYTIDYNSFDHISHPILAIFTQDDDIYTSPLDLKFAFNVFKVGFRVSCIIKN